MKNIKNFHLNTPTVRTDFAILFSLWGNEAVSIVGETRQLASSSRYNFNDKR